MTSQTDLDQGGTSRSWVRTYLGPSVGWVWTPQQNILPITAAGSYTIDLSTTLVTINVAALVTITLPSAKGTSALGGTGGATDGAVPGVANKVPITIVDIGGNCFLFPTTIQPFDGENIMGLTSISLSVNFGGYVLAPNATLQGWNSISP